MTVSATGDRGHLSNAQIKQAFDPASGAFGAFNAMLKEFYLPGVLDILNSKRILSRMLRRNTRDVQGRTIHTALNTERNMSAMHIMEGVQLPTPDKQGYKQATYTVKYNYARILFTGQAASASRGNRGAFLRLMEGEVQGVARDVQHEDNRVDFGDGTGRLARVSGAVSAGPGTTTVIPVDQPGGLPSQGAGTQYMQVGKRVCFLNSAQEGSRAVGTTLQADWRNDGGGTPEYSSHVVSTDPANSTITINGDWTGGSIATGDYIYTAIDSGLTAFQDAMSSRGHERNGLAAIISETDPALQRTTLIGGNADESGGLGNLTPTDTAPAVGTYEGGWAAYAVHNSGVPVPFAESMLQQMMDGVDLLGDGVISSFLTTHGIRRQFAFNLTPNKRFNNTLKVQGGFEALHYNNIPIIVDKDCHRGRIYGLDLDVIEMAYENDYNWLDKDGSVLHRLQDHDAYQATLFRYAELICRARNRLGVIRDIIDS